MFSVCAVAAFGSYFFTNANLGCTLPVYYSVGQIDERFNITREEALATLTEAETVWEKPLGRDNLFIYREDSTLKVNFVYDERQRQAEASERARDDLETRGEANIVLTELHRQLVEEYRVNEENYEQKRVAYEKSLSEYNAKVESYNAAGGAPPDEYEALEKERAELDDERDEINNLGEKLNGLAERINKISEKGNELISEYNHKVHQFNDTYVTNEEYTQGDYRTREVNVYSFNDRSELVLVLAHEFGHSLAIDHVENPASIMYYLMGGQTNPPTLSNEDRSAFAAACEQDWLSKLLSKPKVLYNSFINNNL